MTEFSYSPFRITNNCAANQEVVSSATMDSVTKIVKIIVAHHKDEFRSLVKDFHSACSDLAMHADVRWLTRGKVLDCSIQLLLQ